MAAVGGSIQSMTISGRIYTVAADADATYDLGGWQNEVQSNGDGTARLSKTRMPWSVEGLSISIDNSSDDAEFLKQTADSNSFATFTIVFASGEIYEGQGQITGGVKVNSKNTVAALSVMGSGDLTRQV